MLFRSITLISAAVSLAATGLTGGFGGLSWLYQIPAWFLGSYVLLFLLAVLALSLICGAVDLDKPQEQDDRFYRKCMHLYIEALISLVKVKIHATGLEQVPQDRRFLLVCNHLFIADPGIVLHCFPNSQLTFISKQENKTMPFIGKFMHKIRCQFIDRDNDRAALKTILTCIQMIKSDQVSLGVFPEGYTSRDGKLHRFRSGVFKIAQKTGVPIVVCTIQNTREIFHNLKKLKTTHVPFHLVQVIQPEQYQGKTTGEISEMVYEAMIADLGESFRCAEA